MKTNLSLLAAIALGVCGAAEAQTCDNYIAQGRALLTTSNILGANTSFSSAVQLCPNHQTGNVLYAFTRLGSLPLQPAGSNYLNRLGVAANGRDLYQWLARPPTDADGVPLAPAGVNANEATWMVRTNLLREIIGAEANLARVTDPNFLLALTKSETSWTDVSLDYGDIQMLRAMLRAVEYGCYTAYSWNVDAELGALRSLYDSQQLSVERLFHDYPALLTFATTNDLIAAKLAFQNGVDRYLAASQIIRNRPTNVVRLFNYDPATAVDEEKFRQTLTDLSSSLNNAVILTVDSRYTVNLGSSFSGAHAPRAFLPALRENGFGLGTFPDPTLGGLIYGLDPHELDNLLADYLFPIPTLAPGFYSPGGQFQLPINTLKGRGYAVEVSTNLTDWSIEAAFVSFEDGYSYRDLSGDGAARRFYRVVDRTDNMPAASNDNFANRIPLTGWGTIAVGYNGGATLEPGEPGNWGGTVWWSWTAPFSGTVEVATVGSTAYSSVIIYTGSSLQALSLIAYGNQPFYAVAGTTYQIQVGGPPAGIQLVITAPPTLLVTGPLNGAVSLAPTNYTISAFAYDMDGTINRLQISADGQLLSSTNNQFLSTTWSNVGPGEHVISVQATDNLGVTTTSNIMVIVRPPNDNFASRIPIPGASATVTGTNAGASAEPGEPNHAGVSGGRSVWWSWTAPASGYVTISAEVAPTTFYGWHYPLLGVYTGLAVPSLALVASSPSLYAGPAQVSFLATAGITYQIAVDSQYYSAGNVTLQIIPTRPPSVSISSPTNGTALYGVTDLAIVTTATDTDGGISRVDFFSSSGLLGSVTNSPYTLNWHNPANGTYLLYAKATDDHGAVGYSDPIMVSLYYPETPVLLNSPIYSLSGTKGSQTFYSFEVPSGRSYLFIQMGGGTGDCDLYARFGYQPTLDQWDYRPYMHGNNESVQIQSPQPGTWHIMLQGWDDYSGVILSIQSN